MPAEDSSPATKADLDAAKAELKADAARLNEKSDRLAADQVRMRGDMAAMEQRLGSLIREESAKTAATIGAFLTKLETYDRESLTLPKTLDLHGEKLRDHESRIKRLETR